MVLTSMLSRLSYGWPRRSAGDVGREGRFFRLNQSTLTQCFFPCAKRADFGTDCHIRVGGRAALAPEGLVASHESRHEKLHVNGVKAYTAPFTVVFSQFPVLLG